MFSVVSFAALLMGPGMLSNFQTQSNVGAACSRKYASPAAVQLLVTFSSGQQ